MALTQLSPTALPGGRYRFWAKSKGSGPFTELSVIAAPGQRHGFSAKTPEVVPSKGIGPFTWLAPYALPGQRYRFTGKSPAIPVVVVTAGPITRHGSDYRDLYEWEGGEKIRRRVVKDERDLLDLLAIITGSGVLD